MTDAAPRRALFLFPTDMPGGAENITRTLIREALRADAFDEIVCFVLCKAPNVLLADVADDPRVRIVASGARNETGGLFHLASVLVRHRYDFVFGSHTHLNGAAALMRRLGLLRTARLVTRESTTIFERDMGFKGNLAKKLYRFYGSQDLVVCQSERMAQSLADNTGGRFADLIETVPNPVDAGRFAVDGERGDGFRIAWCGRLSAVKSPLRALDTLAALHANGGADAHLVMIGEGDMRGEIEDHAGRLGLSQHLTLTGRLDNPAVAMASCRMGLLTSDVEGFPNVILEMLAAGVDGVVTTDCAGGLDGIPGVTVTGSTPDALASALLAPPAASRADILAHLAERSPEAFFRRLSAA